MEIAVTGPSTSAAMDPPEIMVRPKKRGRIGRACFQCRRRKIACSNETPCVQCLSRGEGNLCQGTSDPRGPASDVRLSVLNSTPELAANFIPASAGSVEYLAGRIRDLEVKHAARIEALEKALFLGSMPSRSHLSLPPQGEQEEQDALDGGGQDEDETSSTDALMEAALAEVETRTLGAIPTPPTTFGSDSQPRPPTMDVFQPWLQTTTILEQRPFAISGYHLLFDHLIDLRGQSPTLQSLFVGSLPSVVALDILVGHFRSALDPLWHVLHGPTFDAEYDEFKSHVVEGKSSAIDFGWLACLVSICTLACDQVTAPMLHALGWTRGQGLEWRNRLFALSQQVLSASGWLEHPSVRALQAILLLSANIPHAGSPFGSDFSLNGVAGARQPTSRNDHQSFRFWLGAAITLARRLALHNLSEDDTSAPGDDLTWPGGGHALKRQMACRLWCFVVMADRKTSDEDQNQVIIKDGCYTTPLPLRTRDADLVTGLVAMPCNSEEPSDADALLLQHELSKHICRVSKLPSTADSLHHATVLDLDAQLREVMKRLGARSVHSVEKLPLGESGTGDLCSAIHNQILRLHRPYFLRSLQQRRAVPPPQPDEHMTRSAASCLESARAILAIHRHQSSTGERFMWWWLVAHVFSAAIVVFLHRLSRLQRGASDADQEAVSDKALFDATLALLDRVQSQDSRHTPIARQSANFLLALRERETEWIVSIEPVHSLLASVKDIDPVNNGWSPSRQDELASMLNLFDWDWPTLNNHASASILPEEMMWTFDPLISITRVSSRAHSRATTPFPTPATFVDLPSFA